MAGAPAGVGPPVAGAPRGGRGVVAGACRCFSNSDSVAHNQSSPSVFTARGPRAWPSADSWT